MDLKTTIVTSMFDYQLEHERDCMIEKLKYDGNTVLDVEEVKGSEKRYYKITHK